MEIPAILINSTQTYLHAGCYFTSAGLKNVLTSAGVKVVLEFEVNNPRLHSASSLLNQNPDVWLILNGEGTLHDDQPYARVLLEFLNRYISRSMILNSGLQRMSLKFLEDIKEIPLFQLRTIRDFQEARKAGIENCVYCPDMLFWSGLVELGKVLPKARATNIVFTDSHVGEASRDLASLYFKCNQPKNWLNIHYFDERQITRKELFEKRLSAVFSGVLANTPFAYKLLNRASRCKLSQFVLQFANATGVVTGRYHAACMALALGIPFRFVNSNTSKIQALAHDFGSGLPVDLNADMIDFPDGPTDVTVKIREPFEKLQRHIQELVCME